MPENNQTGFSNSRFGPRSAPIGIVHGNVNISMHDSDPPEAKFEQGKTLLLGGQISRARERMSDAVVAGFESPELDYYKLLASFAGRSLNDVGEDETAQMRDAYARFDSQRQSQWKQGGLAIISIVEAAMRNDEGEGRHVKITRILNDLPADRHAEIVRFVKIRGDLIDQEFEKIIEADIQANRRANDRQERVPLFFMADPSPPEREIVDSPITRPIEYLQAYGSLVLGLLGMTSLLYFTLTSSILSGIVLLCCLVGGAIVGHEPVLRWFWHRKLSDEVWRIRHQTTDENLRRVADRWSSLSGTNEGPKPNFVNDLANRVARRFEREVSESEQDRHAARLYMVDAFEETLRQHGKHGASASSLDWLVDWHVDEFRANRDLVGVHAPLDDRDRLLTGVTFTLACVGALAALFTMTILSLIVTALAVFGLHRYALPIYLRRRHHQMDDAEAERRYESQLGAYNARKELLEARPTSAEMAAWLDYDKLDFKLDCIRRSELTDSQILDSIMLTSAAEGSVGAREANGPPRYTAYELKLFLLTKTGIRYFHEKMDFTTGLWTSPKRTSFRYESIGSVWVDELKVRTDRMDRQENGDGSAISMLRDFPREIWIGSVLRIELSGSSDITVHATNEDQSSSSRSGEDREVLAEAAVDAAGFPAASSILELVAIHGVEWLESVKLRNGEARRKHLDWKDSLPDS